jgi:hypothetical protein
VNNVARALFIAGLCVLGFAFFSSWLAGLGTIGEEYRTVGILKFNPNNVAQWVRLILELGVSPIAIGLALLVTPFVLGEKISTGWERRLCLVFGGLSAAWGILHLQATYVSYTEALGWAVQWNVSNITGSLNVIYIGYGCIAVLWLVSGAFLLFTPICFSARVIPSSGKPHTLDSAQSPACRKTF